MTLLSSGESGDPCGVPSSLACHQPALHDARFQVAPDQPEHPLVMHPSCDPGHQSVVLNAIEKRVQIKIDAPRRVISDELACPLDSMMLRAPRAKPEAVGMELRIEDRREHLRDGLADQPIHRSRHPQLPHAHPRAWGSSPSARAAAGKCPRQAASGPAANGHASHGRSSFVLIPSMPAAPAFCSTRLSASARFSRAMTLLPQARLGGVRSGVARRRGWTALWTGVFGLHPRTLPRQAPCGVGCVQRPSHEHERPAPRLRVRPFPAISDPRR